MSGAYRCEKCKKYFDGCGYEIQVLDRMPDGEHIINFFEVCPRCLGMIVKFCHHKLRGRK